jgi:branched-chain amino acid transport system ATP-binding protein
MHDHILSAQHVRVRFGGVTALDLDRLDIPATGSVTALLMGANGAGKTTFLDALSGFVSPASGASLLLRADGETDIVAASRVDRVRAGLARTFQRPPVFGSLTVSETLNLAASGGLRQFRARASNVAPHVSHALGISQLLPHRTASLPLHFLRRVELARVLVTQPRLLLLDEPTAGSDDAEREHLVRLLTDAIPKLIGELHATGAYRFACLTMCVVTHDMELAEQLSRAGASPQTHIFAQGRIHASGNLQSLVADQGLRAAYFGEP